MIIMIQMIMIMIMIITVITICFFVAQMMSSGISGRKGPFAGFLCPSVRPNQPLLSSTLLQRGAPPLVGLQPTLFSPVSQKGALFRGATTRGSYLPVTKGRAKLTLLQFWSLPNQHMYFLVVLITCANFGSSGILLTNIRSFLKSKGPPLTNC